MNMNPVIHFEMPYEDAKRLMEFYNKVFGWENKHFPEMGNYVVATTTESNDKGPLKPGIINGGFFPKDPKKAGMQCPSVVIQVPDIKEHMKKITQAGGKVFGEPVEIPGVGWYVSFQDTEGNRVSILQPAS